MVQMNPTLPLSTPMSEIPFVFLDTETTGIYPDQGARICEIAIIKTRGGKILGSYEQLLNPGRKIPKEASAINHITNEMVEGQPYFRQAADEILDFLKDSVLVMHNAPFDMGFLQLQLRVIRKPSLSNPVIDSLFLARKYYKFPGNRLSHIGKALGLQAGTLHRALGDIELLVKIVDRFLQDFQGSGARTLEDLLLLQEGGMIFPEPAFFQMSSQLEEMFKHSGLVSLEYREGTDKTHTIKAEPLDILVHNGDQYLLALEPDKQKQHQISLERIVSVSISPDTPEKSSFDPLTDKNER